MKTIRRKYKRRFTSRYKNKKSKKCRQSIRQKKYKTKKIYNYRRKNKKIHQRGGEGSDDDDDENSFNFSFSGRASTSGDEEQSFVEIPDPEGQSFVEIPDPEGRSFVEIPDPEELYDEGEEPATAGDIERAIGILEQEPSSPKVEKNLRDLRDLRELYRYRIPSDGVSCMDRPSRNTLFGKVFEEQVAKKYFMQYYPNDWKKRFAKYLSSSNTAEHDIPASLTDGVSISVKSKRIGSISDKVTLTLDSASSYKLCSAKAVRFVNQLLSREHLQLVVVYYRIEPNKVVPDETMRVYDITSQLDRIWGDYTTQVEREDLVRRIEHLSQLFVNAQDGTPLQIKKKLQEVREMVDQLQTEMKTKRSLFSLAHKISSSCGKIEGGCKEQCRLQVVLDVQPLDESPPLISELLSPTFLRERQNPASRARRKPKVSQFPLLPEPEPESAATAAPFQLPIATATAAPFQLPATTSRRRKLVTKKSHAPEPTPTPTPAPTPSKRQITPSSRETSEPVSKKPKSTSSTRGDVVPRWILQQIAEMEEREKALKSQQSVKPDMDD